jgi:phosphonate transport system substrate-binding protein
MLHGFMRAAAGVAAALVLIVGCGDEPSTSGGASEQSSLSVGAIPDQDPQELQRLYGKVATYLERELEVPIAYRPVTDYTAAVTGFRVGDLDVVWFGGLTGVQARREVPGAKVLAQRDIDREFHTVFVAGTQTGIQPMESQEGLRALAGRSFVFGSESSTSGRVMPQYFMSQVGVTMDDFNGRPGFSGSHDKTIELVASGTYDAGALNEQVWKDRLESGDVDTRAVKQIWRSPGYPDYHWVGRPDLDERFGQGFTDRLRRALLALDPTRPEDKEILELFGAGRFVPASADQYDVIEAAARADGLLE